MDREKLAEKIEFLIKGQEAIGYKVDEVIDKVNDLSDKHGNKY
tara:strand:+ start:228 stop:356 length:129 start_codon:yes stop_codon:yes gene_type:complete